MATLVVPKDLALKGKVDSNRSAVDKMGSTMAKEYLGIDLPVYLMAKIGTAQSLDTLQQRTNKLEAMMKDPANAGIRNIRSYYQWQEIFYTVIEYPQFERVARMLSSEINKIGLEKGGVFAEYFFLNTRTENLERRPIGPGQMKKLREAFEQEYAQYAKILDNIIPEAVPLIIRHSLAVQKVFGIPAKEILEYVRTEFGEKGNKVPQLDLDADDKLRTHFGLLKLDSS